MDYIVVRFSRPIAKLPLRCGPENSVGTSRAEAKETLKGFLEKFY